MHADRTNRAALTALALALLGTGAAALLGSAGAFGSAFADKTLPTNRVSRYIGAHGSWVWACAAIVCLIVAWLMLKWIATLLLSTDRADDIALPGDRARGSTTLRPAALAAAVADELRTYRGIDSANARMIGDSTHARLVVAVSATRGTDLGQLRRRIEADALTHARTAMADPGLGIQLDLAVANAAGPRAR
jgi:hypothetical protein